MITLTYVFTVILHAACALAFLAHPRSRTDVRSRDFAPRRAALPPKLELALGYWLQNDNFTKLCGIPGTEVLP